MLEPVVECGIKPITSVHPATPWGPQVQLFDCCVRMFLLMVEALVCKTMHIVGVQPSTSCVLCDLYYKVTLNRERQREFPSHAPPLVFARSAAAITTKVKLLYIVFSWGLVYAIPMECAALAGHSGLLELRYHLVRTGIGIKPYSH